MIGASVAGVSVWGPGLEGWQASRAVLRGEAEYAARPSPPPPPALLGANERRRTSTVVRLALAVAGEAVAMSGLSADAVRGVFGSANGDGAVVHGILETLAAAGDVSPTAFHNSVHNAAAGYWTIGAGSAQPATCLGCHDDSFAAALLLAMAELQVEQEPVLLCVYDVALPPPLAAKRPTLDCFGLALVLTPEAAGTGGARIALRHRAEPAPLALPRMPDLRDLAAGNPAGRGLRLLEALAREEEDTHLLPYLDGSLEITLRPCSTEPASSR